MKKISFFGCFILTMGLSTAFAQSKKPLFTAPIGIEAYTYRNSFPINVAVTLDTIKSLGITEMEGPNPKNVSPEEFKKMLAERGIKMTSIGLDYGAITKDPEDAVKQAKFWGVEFVMVAWIPHGNTFTIDDAKKAVDDFDR